MLLYFDLDRGRLVTSPGSGEALTALEFKRGDTLPVLLRFTRGLLFQELDAGAVGKIGMKALGVFDGDYLAAALSWTKDGTGTDTVYSFVFDLNTTELNTALGVGAPADVESIEANFELEFIVDGNITSSQTILSTVFNDVNKGDEDTPANAPSVVIRKDAPQVNTNAEKEQFWANLGHTAYDNLSAANTALAPGVLYYDRALERLHITTA